MSTVPMRRQLRVEEPVAVTAPAVEIVAQDAADPLSIALADAARWRMMAVQAGERLAYAENQLRDLRQAADDARARFTKYKGRLDSANERVNVLQSQIITVSAERDTLAAKVASQDVIKQKVWEYRQSLLDGPLFELFGEFCK